MKLKIVSLFAVLSFALASCTLTFETHQDEVPPRQTEPGRTVTPAPTPSPTPTSARVVPNFPQDEVLTYVCEGGRLLVRYTSTDSVQVFDAGSWHTLTRTTSQDGHFVYRDTSYTWHARHNVGFLEFNGAPHASDCQLQS